MHFQVVTDTSANLLNRQIRDYGLHVIPFSYFVEGAEHTCLDTDAFDGEAYYSMLKRNVKVTTTQIIPETYTRVFKPILESGMDLIFVSMSSGISGSCQSALVAANDLAEQFPERRIEVIDTLGASLGEGLVALQAARLRDADIPTAQAAEQLRSLSERMFNVFTVDNLLYLRRGGRLSNLSAIVGTVLNIKPILKGSSEGKIVSFGKVRGRRASIETLAKLYDQEVSEPETQMIGIAHAGCLKDAEYLISLLNRNYPPKEILLVDYEPVTGSHVGPGALALFFESRKGVRDISRI